VTTVFFGECHGKDKLSRGLLPDLGPGVLFAGEAAEAETYTLGAGSPPPPVTLSRRTMGCPTASRRLESGPRGNGCLEGVAGWRRAGMEGTGYARLPWSYVHIRRIPTLSQSVLGMPPGRRIRAVVVVAAVVVAAVVVAVVVVVVGGCSQIQALDPSAVLLRMVAVAVEGWFRKQAPDPSASRLRMVKPVVSRGRQCSLMLLKCLGMP